MRWAMRTFLNTWAISSAIWLAHLPPVRESITGKSKPNKNIFVGAYPSRASRDGKSSRFSLRPEEHAADHHRQTQAHDDTRASAGITRDATGLSRCAQCSE